MALSLPDRRPPPEERSFCSPVLEAHPAAVLPKIRNFSPCQLFSNAWTNTLDTTVSSHSLHLSGPDHAKANPRAWIITGDIEALILSPRNKWFFSGTAGEGIGGCHVGYGFIWPTAIIARALTSDEDEEILNCLRTLKTTAAGTGLIHDSFHKDDAENYTRAWFAWANGLFGQLILHLLETRPCLLQ